MASGLFDGNDDDDEEELEEVVNYNNNQLDDRSETASTWKEDNKSVITQSTLSALPGDQNTPMETKIKVFVRSLANHLLSKVCT